MSIWFSNILLKALDVEFLKRQIRGIICLCRNRRSAFTNHPFKPGFVFWPNNISSPGCVLIILSKEIWIFDTINQLLITVQSHLIRHLHRSNDLSSFSCTKEIILILRILKPLITMLSFPPTQDNKSLLQNGTFSAIPSTFQCNFKLVFLPEGDSVWF